ncbi:MAG: helix-turn-helix domain-containing protein [Alteromonadaceae bacterium]|nr:helix-turn-helix domain-containing protein [Alteromonadaceae bacterium]
MALKFYESPFHVTHSEDVASKMAMKMDLSIMLTSLIKEKGWSQVEAAEKLDVTQSRVSDLMNSKIEKFTVDAMFDMLDALGFKAKMTMPSTHEASICIKDTQAAA